MKRNRLAGILFMALAGAALDAGAQVITTAGGDGSPSITGTGIGAACGVAVDASGNVYVAGGGTNVIRKIAVDGTVSTFAGTGTAGFAGDGGAATAAQLNSPTDVYVSGDALYIADQMNRRVRKVSISKGTIATVGGDGTTNITGAGLGAACGVAVDAGGNVYVAGGGTNVVRKIAVDGTVSTFAGTGTAGFGGDGGAATAAQLNGATALWVSGTKLYITDQLNNCIRIVDLSTQAITTQLDVAPGRPTAAAADAAGNVFFAKGSNHQVSQLPVGNATAVVYAGTGTAGYAGDGAAATAALLNDPEDLYFANDALYIADMLNRRIRVVHSTTLPVSWGPFGAQALGSHALLQWSTLSEGNNNYFEVQRSADGRGFEPIGRVRTVGFSTLEQSYRFVDSIPLNGVSYYRLLQVDLNGNAALSPVASLSFATAENAWSLYPNPVHDQLTLTLPTETVQAGSVVLYDLNGRAVRQQVVPAGARSVTLQLDPLPAGTYLLRYGNHTAKVLKL